MALLFLSYIIYDLVDMWITTSEKAPAFSSIANYYEWVAYFLSLMFVGFAVLFGVKTDDTYRNEYSNFLVFSF